VYRHLSTPRRTLAQQYNPSTPIIKFGLPSSGTTMASVFRPSAHALITGGASGIGYAVAELCLKHSMRVTIVDFNQETLDLVAKNLKGDIKCLKADVGDRGDWKKVREQVGDVDFLMLNAGVGGKGTWGDEEYFDKVL
jgi:short-subunit dehydrogenase